MNSEVDTQSFGSLDVRSMDVPSSDPPPVSNIVSPRHALMPAALSVAALLAACGGGGSAGETSLFPTPSPAAAPSPAPAPAPVSPTAVESSRFLAQASMGSDRTQMAQVQNIGYAAWIDQQIAMSQSMSRVTWLNSQSYNVPGLNNVNVNGSGGFDACVWRKLISSPDTLRQRVTLALSEITVVSILGLSGGWRQYSAAAYLDLLENNAFGNYRTLLGQISTSPAMGEFLTFRSNLKFNAVTGALPDENFARELMQLFSIGLLQLNLDGTPKLANGVAQETYTLTDITGMARIWTGWEWDVSGTGTTTPDFQTRPMVQIASRHETGASTFLGSTVPAGLDGAAAMNAALDILFAHPNLAPFISKQLIQRLVTSNPSSAYVARVATVFNNDGSGVKGNLAAVIKALLLDNEARNAANLASATFGKLREPVVRFVNWARAFGASSASDAWAIGDTSDPATRLGQSPLRSATVFNFFRPGYVPPNSGVASASLVAPEFQLTNESTAIGYINFMQTVVSTGVGDLRADYTSLLALADDAQSLLDELNSVLVAGQQSAATLMTMKSALDGMAAGTATARSNRVYAALVLVLSSPEFLILK